MGYLALISANVAVGLAIVSGDLTWHWTLGLERYAIIAGVADWRRSACRYGSGRSGAIRMRVTASACYAGRSVKWAWFSLWRRWRLPRLRPGPGEPERYPAHQPGHRPGRHRDCPGRRLDPDLSAGSAGTRNGLDRAGQLLLWVLGVLTVPDVPQPRPHHADRSGHGFPAPDRGLEHVTPARLQEAFAVCRAALIFAVIPCAFLLWRPTCMRR